MEANISVDNNTDEVSNSGDDFCNDQNLGTDHIFEAPECEGFDVWKDIQEILSTRHQQPMPKDNDKELKFNNEIDIEDPILTTGDLARELAIFFDVYKVTKEAESHLMSILKRTPLENLPLKNVRDYNRHAADVLEYDICPKGCCIYTGKLKDLNNCPKCNFSRFTEAATTQTARKKLYYRPILPLVVTLLEQPGFINSLNYTHTDSKDYDDALTSDCCQKHLREMQDKFEHDGNGKTMINLLYSFFYDGMQVTALQVFYVKIS
jgi:hypothetical protein